MIFETYIPSAPLNQFVNNIYYYEGYNPVHSIDRFLPDGNIEIIIDLFDNPQFIYDNETLKEIQACHNVWVSGVRTEPISIPSGKNSRMIIVNFKKGRAYPFFPLPINEITDYVVDADLVYGDDIIDLREKLKSSSIHEKLLLIEKFLLKQGKNNINPTVSANCMNYAMEQILESPTQLCMEQLSDKIGYSQKHFIKLFRDHIGITPKSYLRIIRFQKVIAEIETSTHINWNTISYDCGYYDQAHFINDFKNFSGFSPNEYIVNKTDVLNYIPIG